MSTDPGTTTFAEVRRVGREAAVPLGDLLGRRGLRTPRTATSAGRERPVLGSAWASVGVVLVAVGAAVVAFATGAYVQTLVGLFAAYLVAALGYTVVLGSAGQFAFCQNAFMAIGAYGYALTEPLVGAVGAVVVGLVAATAAGAVLGVAVIRTREIYLALLTLAFSQAALLIVALWPPTQGDDGIFVSLAGDDAYLVAVVFAAVATLVVVRLLRSRSGRAFAMIRTDERAAAAMGVNVALARTLSFTFSAFLGGLGGIALAGVLTFVTPTNFTLELTLLLLTMIVIGGLGSVWGTAAGVLVMVVIQQYLPGAGPTGDYLNAALLFVILVVRPTGLRSILNLRATS